MANRSGSSHLDHRFATNNLSRQFGQRWSRRQDVDANTRAAQVLRPAPREVADSILTAARSGEVRGATWDEFDLPGATWTIPASRMKAKKEHRVPLSVAALAVLERAALMRKGDAGEPVFPGIKQQPLSDATMGKVLRAAIDGPWTVHGFRSSFRVWAAEKGYQHEAAEAALAHTIPNKVVAAYLRTDFLDQRRPMMDAWTAFLMPPPPA